MDNRMRVEVVTNRVKLKKAHWWHRSLYKEVKKYGIIIAWTYSNSGVVAVVEMDGPPTYIADFHLWDLELVESDDIEDD